MQSFLFLGHFSTFDELDHAFDRSIVNVRVVDDSKSQLEYLSAQLILV